MSADTAIMPIPGPVDPVPVPRGEKPRADGRALPYAAGAIDALVLDPPYMEGLLRPKAETRGVMRYSRPTKPSIATPVT